MHPTVPRDSNKVFGAPTSLKDDCNDLHVRVEYQEPFGVAIISNWVPSAEELDALRKGAAVKLTIYGSNQPVVSVGVE